MEDNFGKVIDKIGLNANRSLIHMCKCKGLEYNYKTGLMNKNGHIKSVLYCDSCGEEAYDRK